MAIISVNKEKKTRRYGRSQFRFSMTYVAITLAVLVFLNLYCSAATQKIFYQSKEVSMIEKAQLAASEIGSLEVLNRATVGKTIEQLSSLRVSHMLITDHSGMVVYDSVHNNQNDTYAILPQIVQAIQGYDVFTWNYHDGIMCSEAATPIISYGVTVGCVYMMEYDTEQGALIKSLQHNILTITVILEAAVLLFSIFFTQTFSKRLARIMNSMRIIREGNYSHKVKVRGNDELAFLGEEINDLTDRLQTSESKRRQFVSDASHELKTPLASIKLLADSILQNDMDLETTREFVSDIGDEAERLNRMTLKLLTLTKGEDAEEADQRVITEMAPTVERVARMLSAQAQAHGITVRTDLSEDVPILIREDDLYQIAFNLAENGIKYNRQGGTLTISLGRGQDVGILRVSDTGSGIPEDALPHIFERFYRVDKARSRASGGSGLGLSIVRNMVLRNQGDIRVESTLGEGTVFTVEFPAFELEDGFE